MNETFMKEKPIIPLVAKMSLPVVLSMIINALYNFVDSIFVSKISEDAMTAISLVFPVQNLSIAVGVGFGVGISAAVSFYMGAKSLMRQIARRHSVLFSARYTESYLRQ